MENANDTRPNELNLAVKKRKRRGQRKSKSERLQQRAQLSSNTSEEIFEDNICLQITHLIIGPNHGQGTMESISSYNSSIQWDKAQQLAMTSNSMPIKQHMIRVLLWEVQIPKAAAHYTKRLHIFNEDLIPVLNPTVPASSIEITNAKTSYSISLLVARFIAELPLHIFTMQLRISTCIIPWICSEHKEIETIDTIEHSHHNQAAINFLLQNSRQLSANELEELQRQTVIECLKNNTQYSTAFRFSKAFKEPLSQLSKLKITAGMHLFAHSAADLVQMEIQKRMTIASRVEEKLKAIYPDARVLIFGSSSTGLLPESWLPSSEFKSDIDLCLVLPSHMISFQETAPIVHEVKEHLELYYLTNAVSDIDRPKEVLQARVPIFKFQDPVTHHYCDISVNNITALWNTHLFQKLLESHPLYEMQIVVKKFVVWMKMWRHVNLAPACGSTISSYGLQLLVIYYLQHRSLVPWVKPLISTPNVKIAFPENFSHIDALICHESMATLDVTTYTIWQLVIGFFQFYAFDFNYEELIVSLHGPSVHKSTRNWVLEKWSQVIAIEDPIEIPPRDLGRLFTRKTFTAFQRSILKTMVQLAKVTSDEEANQAMQQLMTSSM